MQPELAFPMSPSLREAREQFERAFIIQALKATRGVKYKAAKKIGITRRILWERMRKFAILPREYK